LKSERSRRRRRQEAGGGRRQEVLERQLSNKKEKWSKERESRLPNHTRSHEDNQGTRGTLNGSPVDRPAYSKLRMGGKDVQLEWVQMFHKKR